jgi:membrane associated rhomboid family serine protease
MADTPQQPQREPIFNVPGVIMVLIGLMWAIHIAADLALDEYGLGNLRIWFAFIPDRIANGAQWQGGALPLLWTGFTHAFLHVDYMHLLVNTAWLMVFGTPVGRRYGAAGVLIVFLLGALAGAIVQSIALMFSVNQFAILLGASGGVSALTGAAMRFIFEPIMVGKDPETGDPVALGRRTSTLAGVFANPRSRAFVLLWLGLNLLIGFAPFILGTNVAIAWEAHVGGFVAGLLLPSVLDGLARRGLPDRG